MTATKTPLDLAYEAFQAANHAYRIAEENLLNGDVAAYVAGTCAGNPEGARQYFVDYLTDLRQKLEERNVRLREVSDLMRQRVQLEPSKWRGPDGKTDVFTLGEFKATSVTGRSFDQKTLFAQLQGLGLLERALAVTTTDKDGKERPIMKQEWDIDYDATLQWLKGNQLTNVINSAYEEKERTPQVKGPKAIVFLGEAK